LPSAVSAIAEIIAAANREMATTNLVWEALFGLFIVGQQRTFQNYPFIYIHSHPSG
jgi:hypothetical protein